VEKVSAMAMSSFARKIPWPSVGGIATIALVPCNYEELPWW
jgi:hypothetical protein